MSDMIMAGRSQYNDIMFARSHVLAAIDVTAKFHTAALYGVDPCRSPVRTLTLSEAVARDIYEAGTAKMDAHMLEARTD